MPNPTLTADISTPHTTRALRLFGQPSVQPISPIAALNPGEKTEIQHGNITAARREMQALHRQGARFRTVSGGFVMHVERVK